MQAQVFKLYLSGDSEASKSAKTYINEFVERIQDSDVHFEIIDVTTSYELALAEKIFTTPTLIWKSGGRKLRFIGDLANLDEYLPS